MKSHPPEVDQSRRSVSQRGPWARPTPRRSSSPTCTLSSATTDCEVTDRAHSLGVPAAAREEPCWNSIGRGAGNPGERLAVVVTRRADGSPHASVVNAGVLVHPVVGEPVVGFVARGGTRKLAHLRIQPRLTGTEEARSRHG